MKNKKILIIISVLVLISFIFGLTFATYTYNKTGKTSKLIVGDIYMHYKESNEAILTTAEDTSRFYLDGYLVNSVMASQEYQTLPDNRNELSKCVDYISSTEMPLNEGDTYVSYCKGNGKTSKGKTFQENLTEGNWFSDEILTELKDLNVVTSDNKINSIMASQTYEEKQSTDDTRNELSKCTDYFYSKYGTSGLPNISQEKYNYLKNNKIIKIASGGVRYTKSDYIEFCKGTGSINNISLKNFISSGVLSSEYLTELSSMEVIKESNGILSSLETGNLTLNENIKNQTYQEDTRNEVTLCANYFYNKYGSSGISYISNYFKNHSAKFMMEIANNYTLSDYTEYCKGNISIDGYNFQAALTNNKFNETDLTYLTSKNIISKSGDTYTINSNIANQEYQEDTRNELSKCMDGCRDGLFDEGSTSETFCKGTGTLNGMSIYGNLATCNQSGGGSYSNNNNDDTFALPLSAAPSGFLPEQCNYLYNNNIAVSEKEQLPYFEFTIDGKNTSNKDIIYNVKLVHGEVVSTKTESNRISDKFLIFKLVEVVDGNEVELVNNKKFDTINNTVLYSDKVLKNTNTEIKHTYRLYMIVDPNLVVGNTDRSDYSFNDYANLFASIKVNVDGDYE